MVLVIDCETGTNQTEHPPSYSQIFFEKTLKLCSQLHRSTASLVATATQSPPRLATPAAKRRRLAVKEIGSQISLRCAFKREEDVGELEPRRQEDGRLSKLCN